MTDRERRAFNKGLEMAARCADIYADENMRMCNDASHGNTVTTLGVHHASSAHAAQCIARNIRDLKRGVG